MSIYEDTNPRELKTLLGQIEQGEAALPDFQRDFVWDPNATQELIVSIASNYPAGSLLRIRNTKQLFACREFQGAAPLEKHRPNYLVLDGQQRLTSLFQAFFGVGDHRYFLDLGKLMDGVDFEDAIFHLRANHKRARSLEALGTQSEQLVLPLAVLRGGNGGYAKWAKAVMKRKSGNVNEEEYNRLDVALDDIGETWIQTIDDYKFPVVTLSDATSAEAVCTIFETLNRTGVKLSPFELLTARFWPQEVNLRSLWATAIAEYPAIEEFDIDPYYMMIAISLVARSTPSARRADILALQAADMEAWWERVAWGMGEALKLLQEDCGLISPRWLPYNTILIPLAAILAKHGLPNGPAASGLKQKLTRWYWCSVLGQTYESNATSQMAKDVVETLAWLTGGEPPEAVRDFRFDPRMLRDVTPRQRAVYRGVLGLIMREHPRDFHSGALMTSEAMIDQGIDDHHIFPQAFLALKRPDVSPRLRDCVLNRTLIDRKTNQRISKRDPSEYLAEIENALGPHFPALLRSHLLPAEAENPLTAGDFDGFLQWRQDAIWQRIQSVTGVITASDLLIEEPDLMQV